MIVCFAFDSLPFLGQPWSLTADPLIWNIRDLRKVFPSERTAGVSLSGCTVTKKTKTVNVYVCLLESLNFTIGRYHHLGISGPFQVSTSSELKSLLLSMCIDAPESTTTSHSSGEFDRRGAGIALASTGE